MLNYIELVRLVIFLTIFILCIIVERSFPRCGQPKRGLLRIFNHLAMNTISWVCVRLIFSWGLFELSLSIASDSRGLVYALGANTLPAIILTIIILDLTIYLQHILFHKSDFFWRFHVVHHTDRFLDASSGLRFHPAEIVFSYIIKASVVFLLALSPIGILAFEVILNAMSLFTHSNIRLKKRFDNYLSLVFVTPNFHQVHHRDDIRQTNSNYGFNFSFWDRLFSTYCRHDKESTIPIGLDSLDIKPDNLLSLIISPFNLTKKLRK